MIVTEYYATRKDGVVLNRAYSNQNRYIIDNGIEYKEIIYLSSINKYFTESEREIEEKEGLKWH